MSSKSDISDFNSTVSLLNISKTDLFNTSVILKNPEPIEYCLTKFNFDASKNDELSFKANQYIRIIKKVDGGWWEGKLDERIGWFPSDFITFDIEQQKLQELVQNDKPLSTEEISILKYKNIVFNRSQLQLSDLNHVEIEISESEFVRNEITKDLIHSEEAYIEDINNFTNQIIKPLENETWISYADRNDMFGRIPWLSNLHICLTSELKSALNQPEEKNIGNCFSCVIQNFEIVYSDYFTSCPRAIYIASQYSSNNNMTTFLVNAGCQSLPPILHILSFLHKPIQRITKYSPVLSELLHFTKPEDPGFDDLVEMVTKFKKLEVYLKTLKESAEKKEKLKILYNSIEDWVGPGIENYGELLLESKVHILDSSSSSTTPKTHYIYLLEKLFVVLRPIVKSDNTKYNLVASVPVWKGTLNIVNDTNELNSFQIVFLPSEQSSKLKTLTIIVSKPDTKKQWVDTVKKQLERNLRLTLPSLPKEVQEDLVNDSNQSKKKWKKLVPKFARTKGKNENVLPPYTSSNLLLKTSEGGTLISSTLSNLEHKIITDEKRKQGELLKMKYQEIEKNEESNDSQVMGDYSSGVTTQGYNTQLYDNIPTYGLMSRYSTSSSSTYSSTASSSSKMTTICTKYNAVERNGYNYDNTSSYSEGTVYTGVNQNVSTSLQITKISNEENEGKMVAEEETNDEFDMMMGNSSDEEDDKRVSSIPTVSETFKEDATSKLNISEQIRIDNSLDLAMKNEKPNLENKNLGKISLTEEAKQTQTFINNNYYANNDQSIQVPRIEISDCNNIDNSINEIIKEDNREKAKIEDEKEKENEEKEEAKIEKEEKKEEEGNDHRIVSQNNILPSQPIPIKRNNGQFNNSNLGVSQKEYFENYISEDMKSFDTGSLRKIKTNTWFSEDSKSETDELKRSSKINIINNEDHHDTNNINLKDDIHKDNDVNILLELEEIQKRNHFKKNDINDVSSVTSLKSVQMISKYLVSNNNQIHEHEHEQYLKPEHPLHHNHSQDNETLEVNEKIQDQENTLPPLSHVNNVIYKNENIVNENLSTLLNNELPIIKIQREEEENKIEEVKKEEKEEKEMYIESENKNENEKLKEDNHQKKEIELISNNDDIEGKGKQQIENNNDNNNNDNDSDNKDDNGIEKENIEVEEKVNNNIINKIIEKKIAQEIKDKYGDISNKDLTIKIRINEEDTKNDINIEIKINRNSEDKVPEVTIESDDYSKTIKKDDIEDEIKKEVTNNNDKNETINDNNNDNNNNDNNDNDNDNNNKENNENMKHEEIDTSNKNIDNDTLNSNNNNNNNNNNNDNNDKPFRTLISSPSTFSTQAIETSLPVVAHDNENDKFLNIYHSGSIDSLESKTTLVNNLSINPSLGERNTLVIDQDHSQPLSAVTEMKKFKSPLLISMSSPISSPVLPMLTPNNNENNIVEYDLLEKQFKYLLSRYNLQVPQKNIKNGNRYSDSFIYYQDIDFKNEKFVQDLISNKKITEENDKKLSQKESTETEKKIEEENNKNENKNYSSLTSHLPESNFNINRLSDITLKHTMSDTYEIDKN